VGAIWELATTTSMKHKKNHLKPCLGSGLRLFGMAFYQNLL